MRVCITKIVASALLSVLAPSIRIRVFEEETPLRSNISFEKCWNWTIKGELLPNITPWVIIPDTNSVGMDCIERAKSYCGVFATFDVSQCSLAVVEGSFASGPPLPEKVLFTCDDARIHTSDYGDVGWMFGYSTKELVEIVSTGLVYIFPLVVGILLVAGLSICCLIRRVRRQTAIIEEHPELFQNQEDQFAINYPWRQRPEKTDGNEASTAKNVDQLDLVKETEETSPGEPGSEAGKSDKEKQSKKDKKKKDKDGEATPPQQPTSEAGTSDKEAEKQRKKEKKKKAKEEFKKVSTLVQGIPEQPPMSDEEKQRRKEKKKKAKKEKE